MSEYVDVDFVGVFEKDDVKFCKMKIEEFAKQHGFSVRGSLNDRGTIFTGILILNKGHYEYSMRSKSSSVQDFIEGFFVQFKSSYLNTEVDA